MREWQQTKFKDYVMPHAVDYQSIWAVRDLERMANRVAELNSQISSGKYGGSIVSDGQRNYSQIRPTENRVVEKVVLEGRIQAIRRALNIVPEQYRNCVMDNIVHHTKADGYSSRIWKIWKQRFLFHVAKNLELM